MDFMDFMDFMEFPEQNDNDNLIDQYVFYVAKNMCHDSQLSHEHEKEKKTLIHQTLKESPRST